MDTQSTQIHNYHEGDRFHEHYRLLEHVGSGGFADVWKAKDELVDTIVALKIYTRLDKEGISELAKEYKDMRGIKHPNLLTGNHFDASGNIPYLEMDYCDGGSLFGKIGKMSNQELHRMVGDVANGLAYLHKEGIVHQDIKPENILYDTEHGRYLLSDFGISSKSRTRLSHSVNKANMTLSMTEAYAPPEKFSGNMDNLMPDVKGDIFSLGMTIFELAVGKLPFEPPMATGREMFYSQGRLQLDYSKITDSQIRAIVEKSTQYQKEKRATVALILSLLEASENKTTEKGVYSPPPMKLYQFKGGDVFANRYRLINIVNTDGYYDAWRAEDILVEGKVVLKLYNHLDEWPIEAFMKNYKRMAGIIHQNLHTAVFFSTYEKIPYMVFQDIVSYNLSKKVGKMKDSELKKMLFDTCKGLEYLHKQGIVHDDIKPSNIVYDHVQNRYLISNFDLIKESPNNNTCIENSAVSMTAIYAPPEKFSTNPADRLPDAKGDIFSLGVTLYELATGILPVDLPQSIGQLMLISQGKQPLYFDKIGDRWLRGIVMRCMEFRKDKRPTAGEIIKMLDRGSQTDQATDKPSSGERPPTVKVNIPSDDKPKQEVKQPTTKINSTNARVTKVDEVETPKPAPRIGKRFLAIVGVLVAVVATIALWPKEKPYDTVDDSIVMPYDPVDDSIVMPYDPVDDSIVDEENTSAVGSIINDIKFQQY